MTQITDERINTQICQCSALLLLNLQYNLFLNLEELGMYGTANLSISYYTDWEFRMLQSNITGTQQVKEWHLVVSNIPLTLHAIKSCLAVLAKLTAQSSLCALSLSGLFSLHHDSTDCRLREPHFWLPQQTFPWSWLPTPWC